MTYRIDYVNDDLQRLCTQWKVAVQRFGLPGAKKLARRIKEIEVSANTVELREGPGDWHPITHDWPGCLGGELNGGDTIIVEFLPQGGACWLVRCVGKCYEH